MDRAAWFFVVALLAVDVFLLVQRGRLEDSIQDLQTSSATARLKAGYADEEETLLVRARSVPATFPRAQAATAATEAVQLTLLVSVDDCTNCIEDEVSELNRLAVSKSERIAGISGFFVDEDQPETARRFIQHLSPAPAFPIAVQNVLAKWPEATTPLVLVIRPRDGRILDAHKPIPQDLTKRDAFYARWRAVLGLS